MDRWTWQPCTQQKLLTNGLCDQMLGRSWISKQQIQFFMWQFCHTAIPTIFQYKPGLNTVAQIGSKEDYGNCSSLNVIRTHFFGNSRVTLDKPGDYFFFSSVGKHCEAGQKLWVTVPRGNNSKH